MPGFTALNGGSGSPRVVDKEAGGSIEVRLPPPPPSADEREYAAKPIPANTADGRAMPEQLESTRRDREIWSGTSASRSPRRAFAYPDLANPADTPPPKRKRSASIDDSPPAKSFASAQPPSADHQQHRRQYSATAALAAAAVAAGSITREREPERPRINTDSRDPYDLPRSRDYSARSYSDEREQQQQQPQQPQQHEQHEQRDEREHGQRAQLEQEEQHRLQQRADLWYSRPSREDPSSASAYDDARYAPGNSSIHSPADDQSGTDPHHEDRVAAHESASPQSEYAARSPDDDDHPGMSGTLSPDQARRESSAQHIDPKRRKRNFSNRTKTGCLTCRKRKKKCDETKPECSNCVRGGFICAGYPPQKGQWGKIELPKTTVQIESKDPTYVPPGAYGMPRLGGVVETGGAYQQQQRRDPNYRGPILRIEPPQGGRSLMLDDERFTASTLPSASVLTSPETQNKLSALSAFSTPANVFPTPVSAATPITFGMDRTPKEYQRVPPLHVHVHDQNRTAEPDTPQHASPLPHISLQRLASPTQQQRSPPQHQLPPPSHQAHQAHPPHQPPKPLALQPALQPLQTPVQQQPSPLSAQPPAQSPIQHPHQHLQQQHPIHQHQQLQQLQHPPHPPHPPHPQHPQHQVHQAHHPSHHQHQSHHSQDQHLQQMHPHQQHYHHSHPHQQQQQEPSPVKQQSHRLQQRPYSPAPIAQQQPPVATESSSNGLSSSGNGEPRLRMRRNIPFFDTVPGNRRERDEMHAGRPFYQFDMELVSERERCSAACWKFNNSMNPSIGVSLSERSRLFKEIVQPRDNMQASPAGPVGSVGAQVIVEAPFHADYGYNITIGDDVHIGRNCHISDALQVSIGNRVYIGPNVSFYTTTLSDDYTKRDGVHSAIHGQSITIGDDVYIAGNVTILGGANIGHGATVAAGTVVSVRDNAHYNKYHAPTSRVL